METGGPGRFSGCARLWHVPLVCATELNSTFGNTLSSWYTSHPIISISVSTIRSSTLERVFFYDELVIPRERRVAGFHGVLAESNMAPL